MGENVKNKDEKIDLPHHRQEELCTTRLPYRQGRKLTAVKVYTVNRESNHLLVFGVPSLNLRQEAKSLFSKFGKLILFNLRPEYPNEQFTETYHACYETPQSARVAKRMLDTKNFYGGSLHVCYAPELESVNETESKLLQRQRDVLNRLKNLEKERQTSKIVTETEPTSSLEEKCTIQKRKINMGEINTISIGKQIRDVVFKKKRKCNNANNFKPNMDDFRPNTDDFRPNKDDFRTNHNNYVNEVEVKGNIMKKSLNFETKDNTECEVIDFTSTDKDTISNIDEALNYKKFGNEVIKKLPPKPVNKIIFNIGKLNKNQ